MAIALPSGTCRRRPRIGTPGVVAAGVACAVLVGGLSAGGAGALALAFVLALVVLAFTLARPEQAALALLGVIPFLYYPASAGGFSVYLGIPVALLVSASLLLRAWGSGRSRSSRFPAAGVVLLLVAVWFSAVLSANPATGITRFLSLTTFVLFAWALSTALASGRLTGEQVVGAIVAGATLAGIALIVQFLAQFGAGKQSVLNWLYDVRPLFQGERAGSNQRSNWYMSDLELLRAVFPYMAPPSAGQYTVFGLIGAVWLRRTTPRLGGSPVLRRLVVVAVPVLAVALLMTFSRQAWVGAVVGLIVLTVQRNPGVLLAAVAPFALVMALVPVPGQSQTFGDYLLTAGDTTTVSSNQRINLWNQALDIIPGNGPLGVGPGQYGSLNPDPIGNPIFYAHNVFLDHIVELGIVGGVVFVLLTVALLVAAYRRRATVALAMLAAWLAANLFDDTFYFPRNGLVLAAAVALIAVGERAVSVPHARRPKQRPVPAPRAQPAAAGPPVLVHAQARTPARS